MDAAMYGCCTTDQTFLEYTGVQFTARRQVRGAFTRWTGKHLPELVLAKLRLPKAARTRYSLTLRERRNRARGRLRPPGPDPRRPAARRTGGAFGRGEPPGNASRRIVRWTISHCCRNGPVL